MANSPAGRKRKASKSRSRSRASKAPSREPQSSPTPASTPANASHADEVAAMEAAFELERQEWARSPARSENPCHDDKDFSGSELQRCWGKFNCGKRYPKSWFVNSTLHGSSQCFPCRSLARCATKTFAALPLHAFSYFHNTIKGLEGKATDLDPDFILDKVLREITERLLECAEYFTANPGPVSFFELPRIKALAAQIPGEYAHPASRETTPAQSSVRGDSPLRQGRSTPMIPRSSGLHETESAGTDNGGMLDGQSVRGRSPENADPASANGVASRPGDYESPHDASSDAPDVKLPPEQEETGGDHTALPQAEMQNNESRSTSPLVDPAMPQVSDYDLAENVERHDGLSVSPAQGPTRSLMELERETGQAASGHSEKSEVVIRLENDLRQYHAYTEQLSARNEGMRQLFVNTERIARADVDLATEAVELQRDLERQSQESEAIEREHQRLRAQLQDVEERKARNITQRNEREERLTRFVERRVQNKSDDVDAASVADAFAEQYAKLQRPMGMDYPALGETLGEGGGP